MLTRAHIPVVEGGDLVANPIDSVVSYSHEAATAALTKHFIANGRRAIAFVGSERSDRYSAQVEGYRSSLSEAGLAIDEQLMFDVLHSYEGGRAAIRALIERRPNLDAIVFSGATTAAGALIECAQTGIAIPQRIAIGSLDDSDLAPHLTPSLTAIRVSREKIGRVAAQLILDRLAGVREPSRIEIDFEIVVRGSS